VQDGKAGSTTSRNKLWKAAALTAGLVRRERALYSPLENPFCLSRPSSIWPCGASYSLLLESMITAQGLKGWPAGGRPIACVAVTTGKQPVRPSGSLADQSEAASSQSWPAVLDITDERGHIAANHAT